MIPFGEGEWTVDSSFGLLGEAEFGGFSVECFGGLQVLGLLLTHI
jgi:hypothetical protein